MDDDLVYQGLQAYTLTRGDEEFLHQYVVDARTAQQADDTTKPIAVTFALMGLLLHAEHGWTGRQVQRGHMRLAQKKTDWPHLRPPGDRGSMGPIDVMAEPAGEKRDAAIRDWARAVWQAYAPDNRDAMQTWLISRGLLS